MKVFFVTAGRQDEIEIIKEFRPPFLLVSYAYFKNKSLSLFKEALGYNPFIMLDSGAYTAYTTNKPISLERFMDYIKTEKPDSYIVLDEIGNPLATRRNFNQMIENGLEPIPCFHFGTPREYLEYYRSRGNSFIMLGGTVPIKDKKIVADWVAALIKDYPELKFHVLGTSSKQVILIPGLYSCDSSTWIMQSANGLPRDIGGTGREGKLKRMAYHMKKLLEVGECLKDGKPLS